MNSLEEPVAAGFSSLLGEDWCKNDDGSHSPEKSQLLAIAHESLQRWSWTERCLGFWPGIAIAGAIGVFLYRFAPPSGIPEYHWFVVGTNWPYPDYEDGFDGEEASRTPFEALESYIDMMRGWVEAIRAGGLSRDAFPVEVPIGRSARDYAEIVSDRLDRLESEILPSLVPQRVQASRG